MSDQSTSLSEFVDYAAAASILDTAELASVVRRIANTDPAGLSRREMLEALKNFPVPDDFSRMVGEVQEAAKAEQIRAAVAAAKGTPLRISSITTLCSPRSQENGARSWLMA